MNSEQIQDFLAELAQSSSREKIKDDLESSRKFIAKTSQNTYISMQYILNNYTDIDLIQPITAQLLALYYKGGVMRLYSVQYIPCMIGCYLQAVSKKQHKSVSMFETFFLAIYNEEIMAGEPGSQLTTKKVEEVRIPSIRFPSIYHDPLKINAMPEVTTLKPGGSPSILTSVRVGPYPTFEEVTAESKFIVLTRLMKSVNNCVCAISSENLPRFICLATLSIALSGFSFPETLFRARVLQNDLSQEVLEDFSKKPRQHVNSSLLRELLTGVYVSLFNGAPDLALRAIDAVHQRASYEMMVDVLIVTNAIRNSLLENPLSKEKREELMWSRAYQKDMRRKDLVTNASLRIKRMPEDIPVQPDEKEKQSKLEELVEEGIDHLQDLKRRVTAITLHPKTHRRRKSVEHNDIELQTISEERPSALQFPESNGNSPAPELKSTRSTAENGAPPPVVNGNGHPPHHAEPALIGAAGDGQRSNGHGGDEMQQQQPAQQEDENQVGRRRSADLSEKGAYSVGGLRHMDSGSSTQRSIDYS